MKISCTCGAVIVDNGENLKHKGHIVSDRYWNYLWNAIDDAVEKSGSSPKEKEAACMKLRELNIFKTAWECSSCGKLYIDDGRASLVSFKPESSRFNEIFDKKN